MKQSSQIDDKLALLKEKRKQRNDMRKTIEKMSFTQISEFSRVTAPSSN